MKYRVLVVALAVIIGCPVNAQDKPPSRDDLQKEFLQYQEQTLAEFEN